MASPGFIFNVQWSIYKDGRMVSIKGLVLPAYVFILYIQPKN